MSTRMSTQDDTLAPRERTPIVLGARGLHLDSLEDLYRFATAVAKTPFAPRDFRTPEAIMIAIVYGLEVGLSPMQSLQGIAVVNGKPSLYGDALLAVVRFSGLLDDLTETITGEGDERRATCTARRRNQTTSIIGRFSVADARRAGLWGKSGPWQQYPDRMLAMRARGFCLRDGFADVLRGLITVEEAQDYSTPRSVDVIEPERPDTRTRTLVESREVIAKHPPVVAAEPAQDEESVEKPDPRAKIEADGIALARAGKVQKLDDHEYGVQGAGGPYTIARDGTGRRTCTCPGWQRWHAQQGPTWQCKHIYAVLSAINLGTIVTDALPEPERATSEAVVALVTAVEQAFAEQAGAWLTGKLTQVHAFVPSDLNPPQVEDIRADLERERPLTAETAERLKALSKEVLSSNLLTKTTLAAKVRAAGAERISDFTQAQAVVFEKNLVDLKATAISA